MTYSMGTGAVEQVDAVEFALVAGGNGDFAFRDLLNVHQVIFQSRDCYLLVFRLRLEQDDGTDVVGIVLRSLC